MNDYLAIVPRRRQRLDRSSHLKSDRDPCARASALAHAWSSPKRSPAPRRGICECSRARTSAQELDPYSAFRVGSRHVQAAASLIMLRWWVVLASSPRRGPSCGAISCGRCRPGDPSCSGMSSY